MNCKVSRIRARRRRRRRGGWKLNLKTLIGFSGALGFVTFFFKHSVSQFILVKLLSTFEVQMVLDYSVDKSAPEAHTGFISIPNFELILWKSLHRLGTPWILRPRVLKLGSFEAWLDSGQPFMSATHNLGWDLKSCLERTRSKKVTETGTKYSQLAVGTDEGMRKLWKLHIASGGLLPNNCNILPPEKTDKWKG